MSSYVFISNSTKPTPEKAKSRAPIYPSNVSRPCLVAALDLGYDVVLGVNRDNPEGLECDLPVKLYDSHTYRSITALKDNWIAFKNLSNIILNNDVKVIHCNTPVGGLIGRLCGRFYHVDKIIYTAHGFHFYKGAPLINRTLFKLAERIMAHWTDVIITMNQEDYESAQKFHLKKGGKVYKVHGVGIDLSQYENIIVNRTNKRAKLGLKDTDVVCIAAGDLVPRKNYGVAIEAIAKTGNPHIHYIICGEGPEKEKLISLATKLGVRDQIHFLGFRSDVKELMKISDVFLFTSLQEGLPRSVMEAMAVGLPAVVSKIRGNCDLISDNRGGYLCSVNSCEEYAQALNLLSSDLYLRKQLSEYNLVAIRDYDITHVESEIQLIYNEII